MQIRDFIGTAVTQNLKGCTENITRIFDDGKKYMEKIALETKEDIYTLIGIEVTRQVKALEKVIDRNEKDQEARMGEQIENVRREIQRGLDAHGTQPGLHRVQQLESTTKALAEALGGTQAGFH